MTSPAGAEASFARASTALFLAGLVTFASLYATQPLLPLLGADFGRSPAETALTVSAATISLGIALVFLGPVSDAIGRTNIMLTSLFASSVVTLACALSPSWHMLLGLRALLGVCVAGLPAVAVAYLREEVPPERAGQAIGTYIGGTALGGMAGRLVCGLVADLAGWRWALAAIGLVCTASALVVWRLLPASRNFHAEALRPRELTARTLRLLGDRTQLALMGLSFCAMGAFVSCFNAMGYRLEAPPYSLSVGVAGLVFAVYAFGSWSSARAGRAAETRGVRTVTAGALVIHLAGIALAAARPLPLVVVGLCLTTIGFFAAHGVASGWVAASAQAHRLGTAQAASLYLFAYYLGSSVAGSLAGLAWSRLAWPGVSLLTGSLVLLALGTLWLARTPPRG